jgi:hypothetical protein
LFFVFVAFAIEYLFLAPFPRARTGNAAYVRLFGFFVFGVLLAERTILGKNESVGIVLLVLNRIVISMLAFGAFKRDFGSCRFGCHSKNSIQKNYTPRGA